MVAPYGATYSVMYVAGTYHQLPLLIHSASYFLLCTVVPAVLYPWYGSTTSGVGGDGEGDVSIAKWLAHITCDAL